MRASVAYAKQFGPFMVVLELILRDYVEQCGWRLILPRKKNLRRALSGGFLPTINSDARTRILQLVQDALNVYKNSIIGQYQWDDTE